MYHLLRNPFSASVVAFFSVYIFLKATSYKRGDPNHKIIKPSTLVALLVYFIVYYGNREPIMN